MKMKDWRRPEMKINLETLRVTRYFFELKLEKETLTERERNKCLKALKFTEECLKQYKNRDRNKKARKYYQEHKDQYKESNKRWREKNKEKYLKAVKEKNRKWRKGNKEYTRKRNKEYYKNHKEELKKYFIEYGRNKNKTDLKYNLNVRMRRRIGDSLKGNTNGKRWEPLVGYTLNDLIDRLKNTMPKGYTWENLLGGKLHIDHIIPISAFNFTRPEHTDFKRCWELSNLRLLPARENLIKNAKLDRPFQPALRN